MNIVVSDMERSLTFYRLLGVEIEEMDGQWRAHHNTIVGIAPQVTVELDSEGSASNWAPAWNDVRAGGLPVGIMGPFGTSEGWVPEVPA